TDRQTDRQTHRQRDTKTKREEQDSNSFSISGTSQ
ncbi:uncharacterized protein LOC134188310, partial [Corticium candelabrum]